MISFLAARVFVTTSSEPVVKALCAAAIAAAERTVGCDAAGARQFESQQQQEGEEHKHQVRSVMLSRIIRSCVRVGG